MEDEMLNQVQHDKKKEYNHLHLNPLPAYAEASAGRPSRARKKVGKN
jgi:hypothetical protein